jgi:mandelamide amidase
MRNAFVVERLLQHGAIVMGKANMDELASGVTSDNPIFGFVRNPYNTDVIPGGSSGGSAAAIAARIVPAALGTDTAGSIRIPAAFCGTVGFRPSTYPQQLYSRQGVVPLVCDLDTIGPMARSVADVALLHSIIVGQPPMRPRSLEAVRIGIPRLAYWDELDPEVERVAQAALTCLRRHGAVLVEVDLSEVKAAAWRMVSTLGSGWRADVENFLSTQIPSVSLRALLEQIKGWDPHADIEEVIPELELLTAPNVRRNAIRTAYRAAFLRHGIEAVVFPTAVLQPPPIRSLSVDTRIEMGEIISRNTRPAAALGAPALSLPAGLTSSGLPVALELDGLPGNDDALLTLCRAAEVVIDPMPAPPDVFPGSTAK